MASVAESLAQLQAVVAKSKAKNQASLSEVVSQLQSYLVFLNSSSISSEVARRLGECLRKPLLAVYSAYPQPALQFTASLSRELYECKILTDFTAGKTEQKLLWNGVLDSLLSGVLDYLDEHASDKCKENIGSALYPTLCSIFFSVSITHMSVDLRCTGYTLLSECADAHKANQKRLRDASCLGGPKLGGMLWRTRDYLAIENILHLFARIMPPTNGNNSGHTERSTFIRSVFVHSSPDDAKTGEQLSKLLECVPSADWEQTSTKIVDILAQSNIAFPQPFKITEIVASGQKKPSDRLFIDDKGFVANVPVEDDMYESLSIMYVSVGEVQILQHPATKSESNPRITLSLKTPALLGREPLQFNVADGPMAQHTVTFSLAASDISRFHEALRSRGLGHLVRNRKDTKLSIAKISTNLEMDSAGKLVGQGDLEDRAENLSQFYRTLDTSDDISEGISTVLEQKDGSAKTGDPPALEQLTSEPGVISGLKSSASAVQRQSAPAASAPPDDVSESASADQGAPGRAVESLFEPHAFLTTPKTPLRCTASQKLRDEVFGGDEDDLSDLESIPDPPERPSKKISGLATIVSQTRPLAKQPISIGSDDEPPSSPSHARYARKAQRKAIVISDDEIEDIIPPSKIVESSISRQRSVLQMRPLTSMPGTTDKDNSSPSLRTVAGSGSKVFKGSVKATSNKPSTGKVALGKVNQAAEKADKPQDSPNNAVVAPSNVAKTAQSHDENVIEEEIILPSSVRGGRKPVKSALRKRGEKMSPIPVVEVTNPRPAKREREANEDQDSEDRASWSPWRKRAKKEPRNTEAHVENRPVERATPTSEATARQAPRSAKRYGGRKTKAPSPDPDSEVGLIDHDDAAPEDAPSLRKSTKTEALPTPLTRLQKKGPTTREPSARQRTPKMTTNTSRITRKKGEDVADKKTVIELGDSSDDGTEVEVKPLVKTDLRASKLGKTEERSAKTAVSTPRKTSQNKTEQDGRSVATPQSSRKLRPRLQKKDRKTESDEFATVKPEGDSPPAVVESKITTRQDTKPSRRADQKTAQSKTLPVNTNASFAPVPAAASKVTHPALAEGLEEASHKADPVEKGSTPAGRSVVIKSPTRSVEPNEVDEGPLGNDQAETISLTSVAEAFALEIKETSTPGPRRLAKLEPQSRPKPRYSSPVMLHKNAPYDVAAEKEQPPGIEDLAEVLQELNNAILRKITGKVEGVRHAVRIGRDRLLAEAAEELEAMQTESVERYNTLIQLEAEYATFCRNLTHGFEDLVKADQDARDRVKTIIQTHDRRTLSKTIPATFLPCDLPASILKFKKK